MESNELNLLLKINSAIAAIQDKDELYRVIMDYLYPEIRFDDAVVIVLEEEGSTYNHLLTMSPPERQANPHYGKIVRRSLPFRNSLIEYFAEQEDIFVWNLDEMLAQFPDYPGLQLMKETGLKHCFNIKLRAGGRKIGLLLFLFSDQSTFLSAREEFYLSVANQIAIAVSHILSSESEERQRRQKDALASISKAIATVEDRRQLFKVIYDHILRFFPFDSAGLFVVDPSHQFHEEWTDEGILPNGLDQEIWKQVGRGPFEHKGSPVEAIMKADATVLIDLTDPDSPYLDHPQIPAMIAFGLKQMIGGPLKVDGQAIGMMCFNSIRSDAYSEKDYPVFKAIADQLAIAVRHILAKERLEQSEREKTLQLEVNNALLVTKDMEELCVTLARRLAQLIDFETFGLSIWHKKGDLHYWNVLSCSKNNQVVSVKEEIKIPKKERGDQSRIMAAEFEKPAGVFVGDDLMALCSEFPVYAYCHSKYRFRSLIRFPFELRENLLARIFIASAGLDAFTQDNFELLEHLIPQTSLALCNILTIEEINRLKELVEREKSYLTEEIKTRYNFEEIIGTSQSMQQVFGQIHQVAQTDSTVLITGETGTGKELIARAIHNISPRNSHPLIKVDCAALPESLVESELFGHERGSFTGAHTKRIGKFELAKGSTIFLDEIGELPLTMQTRLLRVLQEREVERVGSGRPIPVDVRVVAATNRRLEKAIDEGEFRSDLYYRLNVFPIHLPPLRHRKEDISLLADHFVHKYARKHHRRIHSPSPSFIQNLREYEWPGNIRELEHVIERTIIAASGPDLKIDLSSKRRVYPDTTFQETASLKTLEQNETDHILRALKMTGGKIRGDDGAAQLLEIKPTTLESRMKKLGIRKEQTFTQAS